MSAKKDAPLIVSLEDFADEIARERRTCYLDGLPDEIQQQLIDAPVSTATAAAWLERIGYEATGLESWRRKRRAERGRRTQP
jgi:hypothetical protein